MKDVLLSYKIPFHSDCHPQQYNIHLCMENYEAQSINVRCLSMK